MFPVSFDSSTAVRLPQSTDPFSPTGLHGGRQPQYGVNNAFSSNMFAVSGGTNINGPSSVQATGAAVSGQMGVSQQQRALSANMTTMPYQQAFQNFVNASNSMQQPPAFNSSGFGGGVQSTYPAASTLPFQPDWSAFGSLSAPQQPSVHNPESFFGHLALPPSSLHGESNAPAPAVTSSDPFGQHPTGFDHTAARYSAVPQQQQPPAVSGTSQQSSSVQFDLENDAILKSLRDELDVINREVSELQDRYVKTQQEILEKEQVVLQRNQDAAATQSEVSSLKSIMKQLDMQKELAHRKLLDLESEKSQLEQSVKLIRDELTSEEAEVKTLRLHVDDSTKSLKNQEVEYNRKRDELAELTAQENLLHQKLESSRIQLANLDSTLQEGTSKLSDLEEQVARARSLNTGLEEAIRRFDAATGKLDAADEKMHDANAENDVNFPPLDEATENDLKLPAERFSFSTAGLGVGKFELIDPFQNLSFEASSHVPQHNSTNGHAKHGGYGHEFSAVNSNRDAFSTNVAGTGFGNNTTHASAPYNASAADADPFAATTHNSSHSAGWSAFASSSANNNGLSNNNSGKKSPPPRPPALSRVIAQTTGPAGFWSAEFDPFSSSSNDVAGAPPNNNDNPITSPLYFRGGSSSNNTAAPSFSSAFMPVSRTGPQNKGPGNSFGGTASDFDAWDAFTPSVNEQKQSSAARPSSRNAGGFSDFGS